MVVLVLVLLVLAPRGSSIMALDPAGGCPDLNTALKTYLGSATLADAERWGCDVTRVRRAEATQIATDAIRALSLHQPPTRPITAYLAMFELIVNKSSQSVELLVANKSDEVSAAIEMAGFPDEMAGLQEEAGVLRRFSCRVPKVVHFIKTDGDPARFGLVQWLAIKAAHDRIRPDRIWLWSVVRPEGEWWERASELVELVQLNPVMPLIGQKEIMYAAHYSDLVRLQVLLLHGGIYLDWDAIVLRGFDALLDGPDQLVMGWEKKVPNFQLAVSNAVMIARPRAALLQKWLKALASIFDPSCYTCHSVGYAPQLVRDHPQLVQVEPWTSFCFPGWEEAAASLLFDQNPDPLDKHKFEASYAIHLFGSHANLVHHLDRLTLHAIKTIENNFNRLVRDLVL
eukprot:TRINITY_DN6973_c0_g2_i1.p1 TRINITY_DN6973_c0_g2~~TRINITY_DN6973_c0_g2_i1.p1  ORF type:complete len:399 (+),score=89.11 TRINITY_DN6973_c0_g2_i1:147-1343(+)